MQTSHGRLVGFGFCILLAWSCQSNADIACLRGCSDWQDTCDVGDDEEACEAICTPNPDSCEECFWCMTTHQGEQEVHPPVLGETTCSRDFCTFAPELPHEACWTAAGVDGLYTERVCERFCKGC